MGGPPLFGKEVRQFQWFLGFPARLRGQRLRCHRLSPLALEATLDHVVIIHEEAKPKGDVAELGCTVVLLNLKSNLEVSYTLVRPAEADASLGKISLESPVGQSVLKKSAGDEVNVSAPSGNIRFRLERVEI